MSEYHKQGRDEMQKAETRRWGLAWKTALDGGRRWGALVKVRDG